MLERHYMLKDFMLNMRFLNSVAARLLQPSYFNSARFQKSVVPSLFVAVVGTFLFSVPVLQMFTEGSAKWPAFLLSGDIRMALLPQFITGYERFWSGGIFGTDFFTDGGASSFGFRPNLLPFYPPYLASYLFFDIGNARIAANVMAVMQVLHMFVGLFFATRFGIRFLGLNSGAAILFAALYCLSYTTSQYFFYSVYYYQIVLLPLIAYLMCDLMLRRTIIPAILYSPIFLVYMLTNYGPTMAAGMATACMLSAFVFVYRLKPVLGSRAYRALFLPAVSIGLACIAALPLYASQLRYFALASLVPKDITTTAHSMSFNGGDIASAFSWLVPGATPTEGSLHWGLLPPIVLLAGMTILSRFDERLRRPRTIVLSCLFTYSLYVMISFGQSAIFPDIMFISVPILGTMHLYQRYTMFGQVFLAVAVALSAQTYLRNATAHDRRKLLLATVFGWFALTFVLQTYPDLLRPLNVGMIQVELLIFLAGAVALSMGRGRAAPVVLSLFVVATSLWPVYQQSRGATAAFWNTNLSFEESSLDRLADVLHGGSGKELTKVLDLTVDIDSYVPRNIPWMLSDRHKIMNFIGYEPHLAMERAYVNMMGVYGAYNRGWVVSTGVDTVIWNAASEAKLKELTVDGVSLASTEQLTPTTFVSRLQYAKPPALGGDVRLLTLMQDTPEAWKPNPLDGWSLENGRIVKVAGGTTHSAGLPASPVAGRTYSVSLDVQDSSAGSLRLAFGNVADPEPIPGNAPGSYTRRFVVAESGGLWVNATPDFDGAVTNIVITEVGQGNLVSMPVAADNGILRLESADAGAALTDFSTNWTTSVGATLTAATPSRLVLLMWPNHFMIPTLDGVRVEWKKFGDGPSYLDLPAGEHRFEWTFRSRLATLFVVVNAALGILVLLTLIYVLVRRVLVARRGRRGLSA